MMRLLPLDGGADLLGLRRFSRKIRIAAALVTSAAILLAPLPSGARAEDDADPAAGTPRLYLWVIRHALEDTLALEDLIEFAARHGFTDLLVQVRGRGEAYYRSSTEPAPAPLVRRGPGAPDPAARPSEETLRYDPLACAIRLAGERGLRVHAWINVFLAAQWTEVRPIHALVRHPEWTIRLRDGRSPRDLAKAERTRLGIEGIYMSPGAPGTIPYLQGIAREIAGRYRIAGLHLDYIRYPYPDAGYDPQSLALYRAEVPGAGGPALPSGDAWDRWRADRVSLAVLSIQEAARETAPDLEITAAVLPDPAEALRRCKQDWPRWIAEGWCDRVIQMAYSSSEERLDRWSDAAARIDPTRRRVVTGFGLHEIRPELLERMLGRYRAAELPAAVFSDVEIRRDAEHRRAIREGWR